jgi:hypothetical protein
MKPGIAGRTPKRIFIFLLGISVLTVISVGVGAWYLIFNPGGTMFHRLVLFVLVGMFFVTVLLAGIGITGILLTIWSDRPIKPLQTPIRVALNSFFPLVLTLGRLLRIDVDKVRSSYIEVNNQLVKARDLKLRPNQILLLTPHCLQRTDCPHKITVDIENCRRCGGCPITSLLELRLRYGIRVGMATGGTLARKYVREYRPRAIVAIACERDLTSGIQDANPIPVLGVANQRPNGPCQNTCFEVSRVEEAIRHFLPKKVYLRTACKTPPS